LNAWLHDGTDKTLRGGDVITKDGLVAVIRKVRRYNVTEAMLDPDNRRLAGTEQGARTGSRPTEEAESP
jgi:hypothetical protein